MQDLTSVVSGEQFEPRQTTTGEHYAPDLSNRASRDSLWLTMYGTAIRVVAQHARAGELVSSSLRPQIIALYSCERCIERIGRYTPDCVYDDQSIYANDCYQMAGQLSALPIIFITSVNDRYQMVRSDNDMRDPVD